jgi:large subunit ribosomal protein L21
LQFKDHQRQPLDFCVLNLHKFRIAAFSPALLNQDFFMPYAVIKTGGKQYRVESGSEIDVEKLDAEVGTALNLAEVLLVSEGDDVKVGSPFVEGAKVNATVVDQFKGDKVIAFKFRRRKGYHRTVGHRRQLTKLKIESISTK